MSKQKKASLVIVAHPDDETLFLGGLILSSPKKNWHIVCVTDGNADGQGQLRHQQFISACKKLGVKKWTFFNLPDRFEKRLDLAALKEKLTSLPAASEVYTHGPTGEYGHPHHQDVCLAVHRFYKSKIKAPTVWGIAQNCAAEKIANLNQKLFSQKSAILADIYFSETERFIHYVPATFSEGFCQFNLKEIEHLYDFFTMNVTIDKKMLKHYRWFVKYLKNFKARLTQRPF